MSNRKLAKSEEKLLNYIGEKLSVLASSKLDTEEEIQELERLGLTAGKLAEWIEEERVDEGLDKVKCTTVCGASIEAIGNHKVYIFRD